MSFFARPDLSNTQFKQLPDSLLTLSGQTQIATTSGLTLIGDGGTYVPIIATGATNNYVLTYDSGIQAIILKESSASGGTTLYPYSGLTTCTVGGLSASTSLFNCEVVDILHCMLTPTKYPTLSNPSLSTFTINPTTTIYEVGSVVSITGCSSFNAGSINPVYPPTASSCRSNGTQCYIYNYFGTPYNCVINSPSNGYAFGSSPINVGNNVISANVKYCSGVQPYDSAGNIYCTPLATGTTNTCNRTITGVYPWYWGKFTCAAAAGVGRPTACCIKDIITGGTYSCKCVASSTSSIQINFNSTSSDYLWFATPCASLTKTCWFIDALNSGAIGGGVSPACNLFPAVSVVTGTTTACWSNQCYKIYVSNYQSSSTSIMQIS